MLHKNFFVWGLTVFGAFGGFMFGYDIGVINGVKEMCGFRMTFNLSYNSNVNGSCTEASCLESIADSTILGVIVSVFSLGCLVGALTAGVFSDMIGRKFTLILGGLVFVAGGLLQTAAFYQWMILIGRIVSGIGVGILSMVVPVYNAELAPKTIRGRLVSLYQLAITAGIMVSFLINLACKEVLVGWRISLGMQVVLGVTFALGMLLLPHSPRWLAMKGRHAKVLVVLTRIRCCTEQQVQEEFDEIKSSVNSVSVKGGMLESLRLLIRWRLFHRLLIGVWLQLFQQFIGMNVIMYYSTSIFCQIGVEDYVSTAIVGMLNFLTTFLAIVLIDKVGRKALLLLGALGMLVSILAAASIILIWRVDGGSSQVAGYVTVVFICLFVINFAYGWGPVAWVVTSEIFPLEAILWWPILIASPLRIYGTFYLVSGALMVALVFTLFTLPETKGLSLERMSTVFALPWWERTQVLYYLKCGYPWRGPQLHRETVTLELLSNEQN